MENIITPDKNLRPCNDEQRNSLPKDYFRWSEKILPNLKNSPDFVGQIDAVTGTKETFGSMADKSIRCAIWLKKQGVNQGDIVGYCSDNNLDSCIPLFASIYVGAIFNPWSDDDLSKDVVEYFVELTKPKVVFVDEKSAKIILKSIPNITDKLKFVVYGKIDGIESFEDILKDVDLKEVDEFKPMKIESPDVPLTILYTSGTTGQVKGVLHTHGSLGTIFSNNNSNFHDQHKHVHTWFSTLTWISAFLSTIKGVLFKSTAIIHNCSDVVESLKLFDKFKITMFVMGTGLANRLCKSKLNMSNYNLSSVVQGIFGGVVITKIVENFLTKLFPNASLVSAYACTEFGLISRGIIHPEKSTAVGKVSSGVMLKVIDPKTMRVLGAHEEGELCVKGSTIMAGYWKNPDATKKAIDPEGWYHTGDLGYYDEDGYIWVIDRLSLMINYKNHNIPATIIEDVIRSHGSVADVGVVQKNHDEDIGHVTAFVAKCPGTDITEQEIIKLVEKELPEKMWLRGGVYFLDKMPYTSCGKVSKKELSLLVNK
ncbi:4-coumarate--CoA ligase 1-like isoform X1 [Aphidius gifuensis]|uniref:4-coumarate--CoA ligase 1-like isoform X1 n=1 Tax=Aphidius gifuensis TaxID=684658 RepID=UPI001CDC5936|nr:4-coumarate--CoA ligase 1-like isoform X1 [Aphidius gifuensis]